MSMIWPAFIKAIVLCGISIFIEANSASKEGKQWFQNLKQPRFSPSLKIWYFVGAIYYLVFGIIAYRQFVDGMSFSSLSIILLAAIMSLNGLSNFIVFKYRSLKWFYLIIYPFTILLLALIIVIWRNGDKISAFLAFLYFSWLFFDLYWANSIWKLNQERKTGPG